jgi:hypothetical protein
MDDRVGKLVTLLMALQKLSSDTDIGLCADAGDIV